MRNIGIKREAKASIMVIVLVLIGILSLTVLGVIKMSLQHYKNEHFRIQRSEAFYTAENTMLEGIQKLADEFYDPTNIIGIYTSGNENNPLNLPYNPPSHVTSYAVKVEADPMGVQDNFLVTGTAESMGRRRTIQSLVRWHPPSLVFDYQYFLNNWGWWWGGSIRGWGDNRSNWDFDYRYDPYVNGHIFANGEIESNLNPVNPFGDDPPFRGLAGTDPLTYTHVGAPRVRMPNLLDLSYYESKANGTLSRSGVTLVDGVHGDDETKTGIYLEGTADDPIVLDDSVVIRGDAIIKGHFTGQGVLYVGGDLYIAGNIQYADGPDYSTPPETQSEQDRNQWVDNNMGKDLIGYAVRGTIYGGRVNSSDWKSYSYDTYPYGLKYQGDESQLGADGISGTPDDGVAYLDTNGDGTPDSSWYDSDNDGVVDDAYDYYSDVKLSDARINNITNYPVDEFGDPLDYNNVATDYFTMFEGIFYTNHAWASYTKAGPDYLHGSLICRDEAWIFSNQLNIIYDSRIHSRYQRRYFDGDPNRIIDLGLPITEDVRILERYEIRPKLVGEL